MRPSDGPERGPVLTERRLVLQLGEDAEVQERCAVVDAGFAGGEGESKPVVGKGDDVFDAGVHDIRVFLTRLPTYLFLIKSYDMRIIYPMQSTSIGA